MSQPANTFQMTVNMSVLESLGINLYSNAAAVLSELVANAWDADSNSIDISWHDDSQRIVIYDDGCGMGVDELNKRFLNVGYKKRLSEGSESPKFGRKFMGRKGIGKLSVFSIADRVRIYSERDGVVSGLEIEVNALRDAIAQNQPYYPPVIEAPEDFSGTGTMIVLTDLRSKRADITASALRKRLARRFDVLDSRTPEDGGFSILVNGTPLTFADRAELKKLEFIWEFGQETLDASVLPSNVGRYVFKTDVVDASEGWKISGWIGTARKPTELTDDDDAGSLKNIIVLARKRPIQEGIIEKLDFSRLFGNYVTGQIEADFLDLDGDYDDIATSDRQRLIEDDPRVTKLQIFLRERFLEASEQWSEARPKKEAKDVLARYPKLREWVDKRPTWQRESAEKMIGTVASLELEGHMAGADRTALFRAGILAFERVGLRQVLTDLDSLSTLTAADLLVVLAQQDTYESALWVDILRSRLEAISRFRGITNTDEKEKVLQEFLFKHLWMLDASWERATTSERMEENLRNIDPGVFALDEAGMEITGRIDIRYATSSGKHVIVELKRYGIRVDVDVLYEQGQKYAVALKQILETAGEIRPKIEVIFVLGHKPSARLKGLATEEDFIDMRMQPIGGRYVLYDQLIMNAQKQYDEYLTATDKARELDDLLAGINYEESDYATDRSNSRSSRQRPCPFTGPKRLIIDQPRMSNPR